MSEKKKRIGYILIIFAFIISTGLAFRAFSEPLQIEEKFQDNKIFDRTSFTYQAEVQPCTLFPEGGIVEPGETIFSNITDKLIISVKSSVEAEKEVKVEGTKKVLLTLIADKYWERSFILEESQVIYEKGIHNTIIDNEYTINLLNIRNYIEQVGKELKFQPNSYFLEITPVIAGEVVYGEEKFTLNQEPKITFDYSNSVIKLNNEAEKEFIKEIPIIQSNIIKNNFNLWGRSFPLLAARYTFSCTSLVMLCFLLFNLVKEIKLKQLLISDIKKIDKKYKGRIINLQWELPIKNKVCINLDNFKSLLKISYEREQPIFKKLVRDDLAFYYLMDGDYIYRCEIRAKNKENISKVNIKSWGSDPTHAK